MAQRFTAAVVLGGAAVYAAVVLGGAAVYRCDNCIVLHAALAAEGALSAREILFPQPAGVTIHGSRQ